MAKLPDFTNLTLDAVDKALEEKQENRKQNNRLYFSQIGRPCEREIWYNVKDYPKAPFTAKTLKLFDDGIRGEALMAERLRLVPGIQLWTHDENGEQYKYCDFNDTFSGRIDGAILGLLEAPNTAHCWECKIAKEEKFKKFVKLKEENDEKQVLEKWDDAYYKTAVLYMHYGKFERHYLTVCTPGGRQYDSCRTEPNKPLAEALIGKARRILDAKSPPQRISDSPSFYICKTCDHREGCWK